jgi:hypothetical protein
MTVDVIFFIGFASYKINKYFFFQSVTFTRESSHFVLLTLYAKHLPSYLNVNFLVSSMSGALNTMQLRPWHVFLNKLERPRPIIIPKITRLTGE